MIPVSVVSAWMAGVLWITECGCAQSHSTPVSPLHSVQPVDCFTVSNTQICKEANTKIHKYRLNSKPLNPIAPLDCIQWSALLYQRQYTNTRIQKYRCTGCADSLCLSIAVGRLLYNEQDRNTACTQSYFEASTSLLPLQCNLVD